jgi:hypothetical protein
VWKIAPYGRLCETNADLNAAARGLVNADQLLSGSTARQARREVFERSVHGALEAHHIVETGWRTTFPKFTALWPNDDVMPAVNLVQATHRGAAKMIAKLAKDDLKDLGLTSSKQSVTAVLNAKIVAKADVKPGRVYALVVEPGVTTEKQFLDALHKVYANDFPELYKGGIKGELNRIAKEIGVTGVQ